MHVEPWQVEMARRVPPPVTAFVTDSTPVISFGDPLTAEVATIGINPSRREFDENGWLSGDRRRLATRHSLGAEIGQPLTEAQARQVVVDSNRYFDRNPYWTWFRPLDTLLQLATGTSYRSGTACHLDLIQWATDPVWGQLKNPVAAALLLEEGRPHLVRLLAQQNLRLVLAAGRAVLSQLTKIGLVTWEQVGVLPLGHTTCTLWRGTGDRTRFLGWSSNLQSQPGANSDEFKARLAEALRAIVAAEATPNR